MRSQKTVFQELYGGKTDISRQLSEVLLGANRRIGGNDFTVNTEEGKYGGGEKMSL